MIFCLFYKCASFATMANMTPYLEESHLERKALIQNSADSAFHTLNI